PLAAPLPERPRAGGLATGDRLTRDAVPEPLLPRDGALPVRRPEPTDADLTAVAAGDDVAERWSRRLAGMGAHLAAARGPPHPGAGTPPHSRSMPPAPRGPGSPPRS